MNNYSAWSNIDNDMYHCHGKCQAPDIESALEILGEDVDFIANSPQESEFWMIDDSGDGWTNYYFSGYCVLRTDDGVNLEEVRKEYFMRNGV